MTQQLNIAGVTVYVDEANSADNANADTILMIHGWPDTYRLWDKQVDFFKANYRCVRFTLPGFDKEAPHQGYSHQQITAIIAAITDQISPTKPIILMVHDWGCVYGYQYYMTHQARVAKIIGVDIGDAASPTFMRSLSVAAKAMVFSYQIILAGAWKIGGSLGDKITTGMVKALKSPADPAYISSNMNYPYYDRWTSGYGGLKDMISINASCPMFFAYGLKKPFMFHSQVWADKLAATAGSRVMAFNTTHWVTVDAPDQFNQAVHAWLTSGH